MSYALLSNFRDTQSHISNAVGLDKSERSVERRKAGKEGGTLKGMEEEKKEEIGLVRPLHYFPNTFFFFCQPCNGKVVISPVHAKSL